jgi:hypothetical protein
MDISLKKKLQNSENIVFENINNYEDKLEISFNKNNINICDLYNNEIITASYIKSNHNKLNNYIKHENLDKSNKMYFKINIHDSGCLCSNYITFDCIIKTITVFNENYEDNDYEIQYQLDILKKIKTGVYSYNYELYKTYY